MKGMNPRAWSIDGECWCTRVDYDGYKKEWSGIVPVLAPDNRSKRIGEIADTNIVVEFPTGLKDRNGKEICEGDIVKYETVYEGETVKGKGVVNFGNLDDTDGWTNGGYLCWRIDDWLSLDYGGRWIWVVGNIHENPELLEHKG